MIVDIIKGGERVGVTGDHFTLVGHHLTAADHDVCTLGIVPGQWLALYRPARWHIRLWRRLLGFGRLRDGAEQEQIGFARVASTDHGLISFERPTWKARPLYVGRLFVYIAKARYP